MTMPMTTPRYLLFACAIALLTVGGCASTTTSQLIPSPQRPVCQSSAYASVLWTPQWRPDQKDVPAREAAAADGLSQFFDKSGCFASVSLKRLMGSSKGEVQDAVAAASARNEKVVLIVVRELGPILKIGASLALVEGGTEVVLDLSEYQAANGVPRTFTVQWRSGGPGVIKGVATLSQDLQAALTAGLQPSAK